MLHYERIAISEGADLAKSNNNKECMICHYVLEDPGYTPFVYKKSIFDPPPENCLSFSKNSP